ncbi:MAG: DEAD/DEAH box helicase [Vicinamibacterales bacterium]
MRTPVPLPGDVVWIRHRRWKVERARIDGSVVRLDVCNRDTALTFLAPFDTPTTVAPPARRRVRPQHALARLAAMLGETCAHGVPATAIRAAVDILPYQLEPWLALASGVRRILIADEVGLGKTIQAALIMAELQRRQPWSRVLVIAPAMLRDQWVEELADRFGLRGEIADRASVVQLSRQARFGADPWERPGIWIASADYLKQPHVLEGMPLVAWDLVIIDEAHEASGASERHAACSEIARRARRLVMLSATPHSGDDRRFGRLLDLGALRTVVDQPIVFRRTRADVALPSQRTVRWNTVRLSAAGNHLLDALVAFESAVLGAAGETSRPAALLLLSVFRKRALSTIFALSRSLERRLEWLAGAEAPWLTDWSQPRLEFDVPSDDCGEEERLALTCDTGLAPARERHWLRRLQALAADAGRDERKLVRVKTLLTRTTEAVVIFTEFRDSIEALARCLSSVRIVAVLHGSQPAAERRQQLQQFLSGNASVLLTSDVAGQGLNLHTRARWVVSLELPWSPARLEQRIGRVDRIGQTRRVHATLLVAQHSTENTLLVSLSRRALAAQRSLGPFVLRDLSPPDTTAVAGALIAQKPLAQNGGHAEADTTVEACTQYRRRARALGLLLIRKRRLASRWSGPSPPDLQLWTPSQRLPDVRHLSGDDALAVVSVPFVDGTAAVIERYLLVVRLPTSARVQSLRSAERDAVYAQGIVSLAGSRLEARRRRLQRALRSAADAASQNETAIERHLRMLRCPEEVQPELFTRQKERAFEAAREEAHLVALEASARRHALGAAAELQLGRSSIELLFVP